MLECLTVPGALVLLGALLRWWYCRAVLSIKDAPPDSPPILDGLPGPHQPPFDATAEAEAVVNDYIAFLDSGSNDRVSI